MSTDIFIFAGEPSGDLHGEKLLEALFLEKPDLTVVGVGGPRMREQGLECCMPMEKFQVMGFIDVFFALPRLIWQFYKIRRTILRLNPKVVVTIDYPGFNLRLGKSLRKKDLKESYATISVLPYGHGVKSASSYLPKTSIYSFPYSPLKKNILLTPSFLLPMLDTH
jgi:lipid A disaccharide synthetase